MENNRSITSHESARRPAAVRLRTAAAGSFLAAATAAGLGVVGVAPAQAGDAPASSPVEYRLPGTEAEGQDRSQERLAGVRADLENAVAWGSVTREQADRFYEQLETRIERGL